MHLKTVNSNMPTLRLALLAVLAGAAALAQTPEPQQIIQRAFEASERNDEIQQQYTGNERVEERKIDKNGAVKDTTSKTFEVLYLFGEEYEKLIAENDQPLDPDKAAKEQKKLDKAYAERADESPKQREKRLKKQRKEEEEEREFRAELVKAFDYTLAGEETLAGRDCWVVDGVPRPGYEPSTSRAKFLQKIEVRAWIAKDDYNWVRAEAETIDNASFGGFIVKLREGAVLEFTQEFINGEVWMPTSFDLRFDAKIGLVANLRREIAIRWSDFKKFQAESTLVAQ